MALDPLEAEQQERLDAIEFTVNLLWREMAYIKGILEDIKTKTD